MTTPQDGWFGLMIRVGQAVRSEEEFDEKLAKQLEEHWADGRVWDLLGNYGWTDAKRMAFVVPSYRLSVERGLMLRMRRER